MKSNKKMPQVYRCWNGVNKYLKTGRRIAYKDAEGFEIDKGTIKRIGYTAEFYIVWDDGTEKTPIDESNRVFKDIVEFLHFLN